MKIVGLIFASILAITLRGASAAVLSGADVSSLLDIERAGGVFRDEDGKTSDEIKILRDHGCSVFRVRLFVHPETDFKKAGGATQDLNTSLQLGKRIKSVGGTFLLDLHYSDTWADPGHQIKPREWESLGFDELQKQVGDYTTSVIRALQAGGAAPDMVQVGNEITSGILWPDARLSHGPKELEPQQWQKFAKLISTGCKAVRACEQNGQHIKIVLHIHGGGREGLPRWFFKEFMDNGGKDVDFDVIGLSFYPAWKDSIQSLKKNMDDLAATYGKDILLAETAYAYEPVTDIEGRDEMQWPMTPEGQKQFLAETRTALEQVPGGHGLGFVWWYSDSIRVPDPNIRIWRNGSEALFDSAGKPLPAMSEFTDKP